MLRSNDSNVSDHATDELDGNIRLRREVKGA
jgi:hypothetical protein